jgi:SAM-dependent methyltransferase
MSPSTDEKPVALEVYEAFAERYAARVDTKPNNAYYERPATLSLLPDVRGLRVLDAGCGPGVYTAWLLDHGAAVVALDASPKMIELARRRVRNRAEFRTADLGQPLDFLDDAAFDLVLAPLVLDYLADLAAVFREFWRVLRPGGVLVASVGHPLADYRYHAVEDYFATELVEETWRGFGEPYVTMRRYRRPLSALFDALLGAGLTLERFLEPLPTDEFKAADPEGYALLCTQPCFLCLRARKP